MATQTTRKSVFFRELHDKQDIKLEESGTYFFGLTTEGSLCAETDEDTLCVKLFQVTFQFDGGCLLAPINRDLNCVINSTEDLNREINLINGTTIEIAEKKMIFTNSRLQRNRPSTHRQGNRKRRLLPRTPGQSREPAPPPKPARSTGQNGESQNEPQSLPTSLSPQNNEESDEEDEKKWLSRSFVMVDLPADQQDKLKDLTTPEQISILAASYFTKQLRMFTDAVVTGQLIDDIFKLFMDTIIDCQDAFMMYLSSVSNALSKSPDRSHHTPLHRPAVRLATELLRNGFDPISRVILILNLLRTFSHFERNIPTMIRYQTPASVIGSMTACKSTVEVQHYGLDILSKIATYTPELGEKPPLKEVGIEQVIRGTKQHPDSVDVGRAACRVFANLSSTVISLLNNWMDQGCVDNQEKYKSLERIENLQEFIFKEGIPTAQNIVDKFHEDLGIKMEFRRFVFFYANYQHFKVKKEKWLSQENIGFESTSKSSITDSGVSILTSGQFLNSENVPNGSFIDGSHNDSNNGSIHNTRTQSNVEDQCDNKHSSCGNNIDSSKDFGDEFENIPTQSILKKSRSFECLKTSERKLKFDAETVGGSASDTSGSYSDSSGFELEGPFDPEIPGELDMEEDFSFHLVHHLVKKTVKRQNSIKHPRHSYSSSDTDESDKDFLESINHSAKSKGTKVYLPQKTSDESETLINKGVDVYKVPSYDTLYIKEKGAVCNKNNIVENSSTLKMTDNQQISETIGTKALDVNYKQGQHDTQHYQVQGNVNCSQVDVYFMGKLAQTQITVHVITMVFRDQDTQVLQIIDQPMTRLLQEAGASQSLLSYACSKYGENLTLMDLEPGLVISIIDAVRYRAVAVELLHSTLLSLTRALSNALQSSTIDSAMEFFRVLFSDPYLQNPLSDVEFLKEFRQCFHRATSRLNRSNSVDEMRKSLAITNFVV